MAHYIPFRAIRAGKQLSDSKGASAAISAEVAVLSACSEQCADSWGRPIFFATPKRSFACSRNRAKTGASPFDLALTTAGDDFAVMGHALQAGPVRASVGRRDPGIDGSDGAISALLDRPDKLRSHADHDL